jgi:hypothetical protein
MVRDEDPRHRFARNLDPLVVNVVDGRTFRILPEGKWLPLLWEAFETRLL